MSWFLAFAGFSALIILHELGHFVAAKKVGMRVERFSLFFPPYLARKRRGETEYCIGLLPLGGFVKITGMNPEEELPPDVAPRAYYHQPVWKRIVVIGAGPAVNLVIAFVILFFLAFDFVEVEPRVADVQTELGCRRVAASRATGSSRSTASAARTRASSRGRSPATSARVSHAQGAARGRRQWCASSATGRSSPCACARATTPM